MQKVLRFTALAIFAAAGVTACGNKTTEVTTTTVTPTTPAPNPHVQSVVVTPSQVNLNVGQTVQLFANVTADSGLARTVTWSSNATSIATVDNNGLVTAKAAGTAVIVATSTADPTKQGSASITVQAVTQPTIQLASITNAAGQPVTLNNVSGQINVTLNVDAGGATNYKVDLLMNCGNGDVVVATQTVGAGPNVAPAVSGVAAPITLSFNTAQLDANGNPLYKNANCTLKARLTIGTSVYTSANTQQITLNNASTFQASVSTANSNGGTWPNSIISPKTGLLRNQGTVTLTITATNFSTSASLKTINGSFMGRNFSVNNNAGAQTFTVVFPVDSTKTDPALGTGGTNSQNGVGTCSQAGGSTCLGVYQYASGDQGEPAPIISSSIDSLGNNGFTGTATLGTTFRLDNASPLAPTSAVVNANTGSNNYINGSYTLTGTGKYVSAGDLQEGATTIKIGYASPTGYTALGGGTAVGSAYCATTGFTLVNNISDIPTSTTNNAYRVRVFEYDPLGNVRCTDLSVSVNGVATGQSAFGVDKSPPQIGFASGGGTAGVAANAKIQQASGVGQNFVMTYSDTGSGFNPTAPVAARINVNYATDSLHCIYGATITAGKFTACGQLPSPGAMRIDTASASYGATYLGSGSLPDQGYLTITVHAVDQAGNVSPDITRTVLLDNVAPTVGAISQTPASVAPLGSATISATATDNVDLGSWTAGLFYNVVGGAVTFAEPGGTFNAGFNGTLVQSGTASSTIANIFKGMQGTDVNGTILAGNVGPQGQITVSDVAGNSTTSGPTAIAMSSAGADVQVGDSLIAKSSSATVSKGAATPTSVTLTAEEHTSTTGTPNQPFATVYFYYAPAGGGPLVLLGSQTSASITDSGTGRRIFTYTLTSSVTAAMLNNASAKIYVVGVTSAGNSVINNLQAPTVTVVP